MIFVFWGSDTGSFGYLKALSTVEVHVLYFNFEIVTLIAAYFKAQLQRFH